MNASILTLTANPLQFNWGIDGMVLWIREVDETNVLTHQINTMLDRIAFAIELQTGWDHRTDTDTLHPLYGYRLLLCDATGRWNAIKTDQTGHFSELIPLEEMEYALAYEKVMWLE